MDPAPGLRVVLLDGFALHRPGADLRGATDLPRAVQRLVALVTLCGRPARTAVAGELWPDVSEEHAHGSLRSALWRVRKMAPGLITVSGDTLSLGREVRVDVDELTAWARRAVDPSADIEDVVAPDTGVSADLLPGWYEDWVVLERERLRQLRVHALEAVAVKLAVAGRYAEAVQAAYAAVRAEPLRESAHRTVVRVHLAEGNVTEAFRAYELFRTMLQDEVGVAPSPQMLALVRGARCSTRATVAWSDEEHATTGSPSGA